MSQATGNWQQQAGGVGADRIAVAQSELANQQGLAAGQTLSQIMQNAVSQSQAGAGLEQQAGMNLAQLGTGSQAATLQGATAELQAGTLSQQQLQNQQNAQYENILQQISWPFQTNQYLGSMSAGVTPAMGGSGITSGNTKSSMMNTSGVGKGLGALGGKMGQGGGVPFLDSPATVPDDISGYDTGGAVDPLEVAMGHQEPLTAGGPSAFQDGGSPSLDSVFLHGANGERIPDMSGGLLAGFQQGQFGGGGESPMTGRTIQVPYGPDFGGPQPLTLTGGRGQPPPNIHAGDFHFPTTAGGTENLQLKGAAHGAFQEDQAQGKGTPFDGILKGLMQERQDLMGLVGGASGAPGGMPGWMPALPGAGWAGHAEGGEVELGQDDTSPHKKQDKSAGDQVGPLLGRSRSGVPSVGDKTVIPQTSVSGRPSPMMKELMTNRQPDPMKLSPPIGSQQIGGAGSSQDIKNIFTPRETQDTPPMPSPQSTTSTDPFAAPGAGGKVQPPPADTADLPTDMSVPDDLGGPDFAPGGAVVGWPVHMQDGGDPTTLGLEPDTPFTPKGEMTAQVQRGIADKLYGQQPQQMAALTLPPDMQGEKQQPSQDQSTPTPFDQPQEQPRLGTGPGAGGMPPPASTGNFPTDIYGPVIQGAKDWWGRNATPQVKPTQPAPNPFEQTAPTPPSTPITSDKDREQQSIRDVQTLAKPASPPAQPTPPGIAPQAPGGTPSPPPSTRPPSAAGAAKAFPAAALLDQPMSETVKQFGLPSVVPDQHLNGRQWLEKHPEYKDKVIELAERRGINLRQALQLPTKSQPSEQPKGRNADAQAIIDSAARLKMDPRMWAAILHYESRFNPTNVNTSGKGYPVRGLIGFDPENVQRYGEPKKTIAEQMPQVEKYMLDRGWKPGVFAPNDLARAYSIINAGSLDARGEPRWAARDINGDLPKHLANITRDSYGPGDKFLYGKAGEPPETPTRTAAAPEAVSRETPAEGTPGRYGPPPGAQMPSPARKFLYQLAYGAEGATLALREKAMELGLYQQLANWDTLRDAQYGSMTPAAAGEHALKEGLATGKLLGAAGGAPEEAGEPGTISHAAAIGKSPAGARVSPVGDVPSGGSAAGAPAGASSTPAGAPPLPPATEVALQKGLKLLASGNPGGVALGNSILNGLAQRGHVDAETIRARIQAAKEAGPVIIPGMGPGRYDPTTGSVEPLTPGGQRLPGVLPPPAPGTTGAGVGPTAPAPGPMGAPAGAPSPASPASGRPTPLPTGAEPRPPPGASPAAAAIHQDPAFQPIAQTPRSSAEMFNDPTANAYARDERAWTPNGQAMIKEEAQQAVKDARGHLDADRQADVMLSEIEENLEKLPKTGVLAPGPTMQIRNHIIGIYNDLARITAPALGKDALPQVAPATVGSVEQINKLANTLAFALARTLGSREAVQIVQQARNSVPSADVSPAGARYILQNLRAGIAMDRDYFSGLQNWSSSNLMYGNSIKGFDDWFAQTHPSTMYAMRAAALAARDDNDKPIDREALDLLKSNPDKYQKFEEHFHTPGLGRYYLERQMTGAP